MNFDAVDRHGTDSIKWDDTLRRFGRKDLMALWVADMDLSVPQVIQDALIERAEHPVYGYTFYSDEFYEAIKWWYTHHFGWELEKEWIMPEHGVVVSINMAIDAYSKEGDGVLIQTPIYPPFFSSVERHQRKVIENRLVYTEGHYTIDWSDFEAKAKEAKLFLLCSPHNPTTRAWTKEELIQMASICKRNNVVIVSDEIHSDVVYGDRHIPMGNLDVAKDITVTLHAPSKTFNIAGLNTSYVVIPDDELRRIYQTSHDKTGLSHGTPFGVTGLEKAYTPEGVKWLKELIDYLQENISFVTKYLKRHIPQILPIEPEATFLIWLDCRGLGLDDDGLEKLFFDEAGLALNKGVSFGEAGSGFMRLNIGTSQKMLEQALDQLKGAVDRMDR
jgi:cystathionine beta-lyase